MIRQLENSDQARLLAFLNEKPEPNLFMIGDVENFGVRTDFQEVWGDLDANGAFRAAALRYYDIVMVYARPEFDADAMREAVARMDFGKIMGDAPVIVAIVQSIPIVRKQAFILARLADGKRLRAPSAIEGMRKLTAADVERVIAFRKMFSEFGGGPNPESARRQLDGGHARGYWIERDGAMVAMAQTTAECSRGAMIVGVGTLPAWRQRGYATELMTKICQELIDEGKMPCLFYENPAAGAIYRRMGFEEIGEYALLALGESGNRGSVINQEPAGPGA